jgi:hypothetical protein
MCGYSKLKRSLVGLDYPIGITHYSVASIVLAVSAFNAGSQVDND